MIEVTENAVKMVRRIQQKEGHGDGVLRLAIQGGGCNGFSYRMGFEEKGKPDDHKFDFFGLEVVVDPKSLEFLSGVRLDYVDGLNSGFQWMNPNATHTCSCGESFDVQ